MELLKTFRSYRRLLGNQWLSRQEMHRIQERKLQRIVMYAYLNVPYYQRLFDDAGVSPESIQTIDDLNRIPVTTKSDLQSQDSSYLTSRAFQPKDLVKEHTSGSTGRPFTVFFDRNYVALRNSLFLRTLKSAGYSFGQKVLLVAGGSAPKKNKLLLRWDYASILQSPEHLLASLNQSRPDLLYGCVTPLRLLAQLAVDNSAAVHKPKIILVTAESLDKETRFLLQRTFDAEVFEFYGLTEMGVVGWECSEHDGYHISEDTVIVEFLPFENEEKEFRLVVTNLDLRGMPLIRFETGDIGSPSQQSLCACGRSLAKLQWVGGRIVDCIKLRKGRIVSPYKITCTLEHLKGLKRYQLIQKGFDDFTLKVETNHNGHLFSAGEVNMLLEPLLGHEAHVNVVRLNKLNPPPGQKFRVIESKLKKGVLQ